MPVYDEPVEVVKLRFEDVDFDPETQRGVVQNHPAWKKGGFEPEVAGFFHAVRRNYPLKAGKKRYAIVDGKQRATEALRLGYTEWKFFVHDIDSEQEAAIWFDRLNTNKPLNTDDKWNNKVARRSPVAVMLQRVAKDCGWAVTKKKEPQSVTSKVLELLGQGNTEDQVMDVLLVADAVFGRQFIYPSILLGLDMALRNARHEDQPRPATASAFGKVLKEKNAGDAQAVHDYFSAASGLHRSKACKAVAQLLVKKFNKHKREENEMAVLPMLEIKKGRKDELK